MEENIGKISYLDYLEYKTLANGLKMKSYRHVAIAAHLALYGALC